jgi:hypothetical protein
MFHRKFEEKYEQYKQEQIKKFKIVNKEKYDKIQKLQNTIIKCNKDINEIFSSLKIRRSCNDFMDEDDMYNREWTIVDGYHVYNVMEEEYRKTLIKLQMMDSDYNEFKKVIDSIC